MGNKLSRVLCFQYDAKINHNHGKYQRHGFKIAKKFWKSFENGSISWFPNLCSNTEAGIFGYANEIQWIKTVETPLERFPHIWGPDMHRRLYLIHNSATSVPFTLSWLSDVVPVKYSNPFRSLISEHTWKEIAGSVQDNSHKGRSKQSYLGKHKWITSCWVLNWQLQQLRSTGIGKHIFILEFLIWT